jgi:hypothetical protein
MANGPHLIKVYVPSIALKNHIRTLASAQGLSMSEFLLAPVLGQANHHRSLVRAEGALLNPQTYARLVEIAQALRSLSSASINSDSTNCDSINSNPSSTSKSIDYDILHQLLHDTRTAVESTARDILFSRSISAQADRSPSQEPSNI